jgi:predicted extracellular nuclease
VTPAGPGAAIAPTVVGQGGRVPPASVIEDDATGSVETSGVFDPETDGIDFYESLEAMLLQVNNPVVTGPRNGFGEVWVLADDGAGAALRTTRGGIVIRPTDFNPERIQLEDDIVPGATPEVNVGDHFTTAAVGVLEYNFGNFEVMLTSALTRVDGGLVREVTTEPKKHELSVATFNVENLDPLDGAPKFAELAELIVDHLRSPAIVALEEVQDNNGPVNDATTDASLTYETLIAAIEAAGGPTYDFRQVDPVDDADGGEPGGNIRVGFLFRTDYEDLEFVDRPGATPTTANSVVATRHGAQLRYSPGRIDPTNPAFANSRKPLAGEFLFRHRRLILVANHFNSKGGDHPLFGRFQPPVRSSEVQRHQQAQIVNDFVDQILAVEPKANVVVLGDLNDFEFSTTLELLEGGVLTTLIETLPPAERYTYVFEGNSQSLDHILVSDELAKHDPGYDVVHVNAEFAQQASDHDPQVARLDVHGPAVP